MFGLIVILLGGYMIHKGLSEKPSYSAYTTHKGTSVVSIGIASTGFFMIVGGLLSLF